MNDPKPKDPGKPDPRDARHDALDRIRRSLEKKHQLDELRKVYHERRRTMTDDERAAISDEMARLRRELDEQEGAARG